MPSAVRTAVLALLACLCLSVGCSSTPQPAADRADPAPPTAAATPFPSGAPTAAATEPPPTAGAIPTDGAVAAAGTPAPTPAGAATGSGPAVLLAAGDIAVCGSPGAEETAELLDGLPGLVLALGDNAYQSGTAREYADCYGPTWGRLKARTRPAPGNHDYATPDAAGYFGFFGAIAGDPTLGYYSFDYAGWHLVALNTNCYERGWTHAPTSGCRAGSPEERWLRADLAAHPAACTLAYGHHPRFSSGLNGDGPELEPLWRALYEAGADVVLAGHDHDYERFAPQDPQGRPDPPRGIRAFVVGTGGAPRYPFKRARPNSEARDAGTFGVLQLTLRPGGYHWAYLPVKADAGFTDTGTAACHHA